MLKYMYICIGKYISCFEITIFQIQENEFNLYTVHVYVYIYTSVQ